MKSLKIFTVAMALIFTLSVVSSHACDKHKTSAKNECSTSVKNDTKSCCSSDKTVSKGECSTTKVVQTSVKNDTKSCCSSDKTVSKGECSTTNVLQTNVKADTKTCTSGKVCTDSKLEAKNDATIIKPVSEGK